MGLNLERFLSKIWNLRNKINISLSLIDYILMLTPNSGQLLYLELTIPTAAGVQSESAILTLCARGIVMWIAPYISIHFLSLNPLLVRRSRYSGGERYPSAYADAIRCNAQRPLKGTYLNFYRSHKCRS